MGRAALQGLCGHPATPAPYRWGIPRDRIGDPNAAAGTCQNAQGRVGPRNASNRITKNRTRFALYDDDGACYYEGLIFGDFDGFEPLEDFGAPNAGCARIKLAGVWL